MAHNYRMDDATRLHFTTLARERPALGGRIVVDPLSPESIRRAVECMRGGGVVFFFSRATYGLATNGFSREGVERIYRIKGREGGKALAMLCAPGQIEAWATVAPAIREDVFRLVARHWPGCVTLIASKRSEAGAFVIPDAMTAGLPTVSLMCMDEVAAALASAADFPVAATSANRSGKPGIVDPAAGVEEFGDDVDLYLLGPTSDIGANTTIVDLTSSPPRILRPGPASAEAIREFLPALAAA